MTARFLADGSCELVDGVGGRNARWASVAEWAGAWFGEWRREDHGDACEFVGDACADATSGVVDALVVLAETADGDKNLLGWVGAGPIEDLVSHHGHGLSTLDDVARAARQNIAFRGALGNVWLSGDVPELARSRLGELGAQLV